MGKAGDIAKIVAGIVFASLIMWAGWTVLTDSTDYAASQTSNTTYPFAYAFCNFAPVLLAMVPAGVGIALIIWRLRSRG